MMTRNISQVIVAMMLVGVAVAVTVLAGSIITASISRREGRRSILASVGVSDISLGYSSADMMYQPIYITVRVASFAESNVEIVGGEALVLLIGRSYARFIPCYIGGSIIPLPETLEALMLLVERSYGRFILPPGASTSLQFICFIDKQELRDMLPANWNSDVLRSSMRVVTARVLLYVHGGYEYVLLV